MDEMLHSTVFMVSVLCWRNGLIAGVRITVNDELQFDGTMKAKLDALFGA